MWDDRMMSPRKNTYIHIYLYIHDSWLERKRPKIIQNHRTSSKIIQKPPMSWTTPRSFQDRHFKQICHGKKKHKHLTKKVCGATTSKPAIPRPPWRRVEALMPPGPWKQGILGIATFISVPRLEKRLVLWLAKRGLLMLVMACWCYMLYDICFLREIFFVRLVMLLARFWSWVLLDICRLLLIRFFRKE